MQTAEHIVDVLGGYMRASPDGFAKLSEITDWETLARWEEARRAAQLLAVFDDQTVAAIAAGAIDLQALCRKVAAGHK